MSKNIEDFQGEEAEELREIIGSFMEDIGSFAIEQEVEDQYSSLLMFTFETIVEESVSHDEDVKTFAENFLSYVEALLEDGHIDTNDEEELEERFEEAKQMIKNKEGRSRE